MQTALGKEPLLNKAAAYAAGQRLAATQLGLLNKSAFLAPNAQPAAGAQPQAQQPQAQQPARSPTTPLNAPGRAMMGGAQAYGRMLASPLA